MMANALGSPTVGGHRVTAKCPEAFGPHSLVPDAMSRPWVARRWTLPVALLAAWALAGAAYAEPPPQPTAGATPVAPPPSPPAAGNPAVVTAPLLSGDVPDDQKRPRTVAILPFRDQAVRLADLFASEIPAAAVDRLETKVAQALAAEAFVSARDVGEVRQTLADDHAVASQGQLAQQLYRIGLDLYWSLAPGRAAVKLQQAVAAWRELYQDVFDPKPCADAQFMYGVALVDSGRTAEGHIALKDAFALQTDRHFRPNFFPPPVERALTAALADFLSTGDPLRTYGDSARMAQLARRLGVAWLVVGALRRSENGPEVWLAVFSAQRRLYEAEMRVPIDEFESRLQPFLSRWLACAPIAEARPPVHVVDTLRTDLSVAYAPFLRQPTRTAFQSIGFSVGVAHEFRSNLEWFSRLALHTSITDPYRDLLRSFNSVRASVGLGATVTRGPLRFFAQAGLDAQLLGSFEASVDPDCKLFGTDHRLCDRSKVTNLDQNVLAGVQAALGIQLHLGRDFLLGLRASMANYFLPLDGTDKLNLPIGAELGLGYRL